MLNRCQFYFAALCCSLAPAAWCGAPFSFESAPGRRRIGWMACPPEPVEALPPPADVPEPLAPEDPAPVVDFITRVAT